MTINNKNGYKYERQYFSKRNASRYLFKVLIYLRTFDMTILSVSKY